MKLQEKTLQNVPFARELAKELLEKYGSPLYVYQSDRLYKSLYTITKSIPYPHTKFHYASVTNGNISLMQIFQLFDWGLHANTPGDIYLGLKAGFFPQNIVYSGSNLNRSEMEYLMRLGIPILNLDSLDQVVLFGEVYQTLKHSVVPPKLGLRLNLPELTGINRIGVHPREFEQAIAIARLANLDINGLHFYRGTGTNATAAFTQVIDKIIEIAQILPNWEYLDFGGGFGYPYNPNIPGFDWESFGEEITEKLLKTGKKINLIIEPGRAAIASCGALLAQVVSVKWQGEKQIVGVDTTVANLSVLSVHGGHREVATWKIKNDSVVPEELYNTDVCGNTTYSRDYLGKNCQLPGLEMGDIMAILDVGAYGYAMSSHFLHRPLPAEVLLENNSHRLIRKREDYSILWENQIFN